MRTTPALYVRNLLAKLHPPLPQTPQQSRHLLNLLETSFRKHLDDTHPAPKLRDINTDDPHRTIPLSAVNAVGVTQRHLNHVLSHPLLDRPGVVRRERATLTAKAVTDFETAIAQGSVTVEVVSRCVKLYWAGIRNGETVSDHQIIGPKIASWLHSASANIKEAFFLYPDMIFRAVPVLAVDRQETVVWEWLRLIYERDFGSAPSSQFVDLHDRTWLSVEDSLVSALMRLSVRRSDLNDAAQQFVEACRYRQSSGRATTHQDESSTSPYIPMLSSWKRLAAAVIQTRHSHGIDPSLFGQAISSSINWTEAPHYSEPVLNVYHPSMPSAQLLCRKLRNAATAASFLASNKTASKTMRKAMLVVLLDGSQLSLDQNLRHDAEFLLEVAAAEYPELLPPAIEQQKQTRSVEERIRESWVSLRMKSQYEPQRLSAVTI